MICSVCGTENEKGFKFCVKCGGNLVNPQEVNYEQVDMGNYHSEDEYPENSGGFTMDTGTFVIRDTVPPAPASDNLYTADELNRSEEEFDFSMYDDPAIPPLNTPPQPKPAPQNPQLNAVHPNNGMAMPQQPMGMQGMPQMGGMPQMSGISQQPVMQGMPQMNGMPGMAGMQPMGNTQGMYMNQQMMYAQPQIIGYDTGGNPIYGQPQAMMPQQPMMQPQMGSMPGMPQMAGMPQPPNMQQTPGMPDAAAPQKKEEEKKGGDDFWAFFDGDKKHEQTPDANDFFGKAQTAEPDTSADPFADIDNRRKQRLKQKQQAMGFMGDTPIVDGSKLEANTPDALNKLYMRQTGDAPSADLTVGSGKRQKGAMGVTQEVDASKLSSAMNVRSRVSMQESGEADADALEQYSPKHKEAIMAQADHSVEAMPKKVNPYESELDKIELPEYMQAKKTVHEDAAEIPSLPEIE